MLMLLNHPLILGKPLEFVELRKSIYYNLALIYREKNEFKNALYFYFNFYKLNPENVSIIVEIAILFRKELMLEQACYFFEQALGKESSPAMKLIYSEQVAALSFVIGNHPQALKVVDTLLDTEFKRQEMEELRLLILSEMNPTARERFDFFNPGFEFLPCTSSSFASTYCRGNYSARILDLRSEYSKKKVTCLNEVNLMDDSSCQANVSKTENLSLIIPKPRWQELIYGVQTVLRIQKQRSDGKSLSEIRSKLEKASSSKYLNDIDFDFFNSEFEIKLLESPTRIIEEPLEQPLNGLTIEPKEVPREERYGGGQMALREKKSSNKAVDSANLEADFTKSLENCLHDVLKSSLVSPLEFNFFQHELSEILIGQNYGLEGEKLEVGLGNT